MQGDADHLRCRPRLYRARSAKPRGAGTSSRETATRATRFGAPHAARHAQKEILTSHNAYLFCRLNLHRAPTPRGFQAAAHRGT